MNKVLSIILGALLIGAIGGLAYISVSPKIGERFTEFYILGPEGKATDYPSIVMPGEEVSVIGGIINHEHQNSSYLIEITIDGLKVKEIGPLVLAHSEKWEQEVRFRPTKVGKQKVEFLLYKNDQLEPSSEQLCLWIEVMK